MENKEKERKVVAGLFYPKTGKDLYIYHISEKRLTSTQSPKDAIWDILKNSRFPVFMLRHSLGESPLPQDVVPDYSNFSDRNQLEKEFKENNHLIDLGFYGMEIPIPENSYSHAVGPIHAGIIEPGHFRFVVEGEVIQSLNIRLGFQRREIRKQIQGLPPFQVMPYTETISGDASVAYALSFARLYEKAMGLKVPAEIEIFRLLMLETERIAIHTGDIGAIAGDIGYYPLHGFCATDRGVALGVMEKLVGSRFGKGAIYPGTVRVNPKLTPKDCKDIITALNSFNKKLDKMFTKATQSATIRERLQLCGILHATKVYKNSFTGMPLRATGMIQDLRHSDQYYAASGTKINLDLDRRYLTGDAWSRFHLRFQEIRNSIQWITKVLESFQPPAYKKIEIPKQIKIQPGVYHEAVESWRGAVLVALQLDAEGKITDSYIRDPSVINWRALEIAVKGELIGDFPLNNKSFNLSYVGVDL